MSTEPALKRRRVARACDSCRALKAKVGIHTNVLKIVADLLVPAVTSVMGNGRRVSVAQDTDMLVNGIGPQIAMAVSRISKPD